MKPSFSDLSVCENEREKQREKFLFEKNSYLLISFKKNDLYLFEF